MSGFGLARLVAIAVSVGFSYGGFIGIARSDDPGGRKMVAFALLACLLLLHLYNCVRRPDGSAPRAWQVTLVLQTVLTAAGLYWFAGTWYGNTGFLAAAVLLLVRPAALGWAGFGVVVFAQFLSGLEVTPTVWDALYLALGHTAFVGLALYGVARFADLVVGMASTRTALADAEVARQRIAFADQLNTRVGTSLADVVRHGEAVRQAVPDAHERLEASLATARAALTETRSLAHSHRGGAPVGTTAADDLTAAGVTRLGLAVMALMLLTNPTRDILVSGESAGRVLLYFVALAVFSGFFVWCCYLAGGGRTRHWQLALAGAFAAALVPGLVFDPALWWLRLFLPALTLVLLRGWARWIVTGLLVAQDLVTLLGWGFTLHGETVVDQSYQMVWIGERALVIFGFVTMGRLTRELSAARAELARTEVARERLRFARDLHDLLGLSLSVIVLRCELAFRLLGRDRRRALAELDEGMAAARQAISDIDSVAAGYREISLPDELASAKAALTTAGLAVNGNVEDLPLTARQSEVLAIVLREGVTNILRHSNGRRATIDAAVVEGQVLLRLGNDGLRTDDVSPGAGLENLRHRLETVGGRLTGEASDCAYVLTARIPLEPALVGSDTDRVDAVASAELHDGGREVVADGSAAQ